MKSSACRTERETGARDYPPLAPPACISRADHSSFIDSVPLLLTILFLTLAFSHSSTCLFLFCGPPCRPGGWLQSPVYSSTSPPCRSLKDRCHLLCGIVHRPLPLALWFPTHTLFWDVDRGCGILQAKVLLHVP